jgi:NO-binding membrane sensor protein with MHYT domain
MHFTGMQPLSTFGTAVYAFPVSNPILLIAPVFTYSFIHRIPFMKN